MAVVPVPLGPLACPRWPRLVRVGRTRATAPRVACAVHACPLGEEHVDVHGLAHERARVAGLAAVQAVVAAVGDAEPVALALKDECAGTREAVVDRLAPHVPIPDVEGVVRLEAARWARGPHARAREAVLL